MDNTAQEVIGNYQKLVNFAREIVESGNVHNGSCYELGMKAKALLKDIGEYKYELKQSFICTKEDMNK